MDENIEVQELNEPIAENELVADELSAEEEAMWDDDDYSDDFTDDSTDAEADADQQNAEESESTDGQDEAETPTAEDADQYLELKHFDEVKKVSKDEAKKLAQMGMDYPRIKTQLSEARQELDKLRAHENFLEEIKGNFGSIEDLIADTRANIVAQREGISKETAMNRIISAAQRQAEEANREDPIVSAEKQSLTLFTELYPDVKAADIPQEVWDDFKVTHSLVASWARYDAKNTKKDNDVLKQNAKNKQRSTGSMKSSGTTAKDEIDDMWYNDDY